MASDGDQVSRVRDWRDRHRANRGTQSGGQPLESWHRWRDVDVLLAEIDRLRAENVRYQRQNRRLLEQAAGLVGVMEAVALDLENFGLANVVPHAERLRAAAVEEAPDEAEETG